jgi:RNA polymerase sigma-70 factor (ECF subfamily)
MLASVMAEEMIHHDDASLVTRLKQRDRRALEDVVRQHGPKLYAVARQFMRNDHDAEEVLQDALVQVWKKIDTFEGRSAFPSWLYRITANAALMTLRKHKRHAADVSMDAVETDAPGAALGLRDERELPLAALQRTELGAVVQSAIEQLAEPYRTTVLLSDVEECSLQEIAALTNVSVPAVKSRLHRGRLALRKTLLPFLRGDDEGAKR